MTEQPPEAPVRRGRAQAVGRYLGLTDDNRRDDRRTYLQRFRASFRTDWPFFVARGRRLGRLDFQPLVRGASCHRGGGDRRRRRRYRAEALPQPLKAHRGT
jgi:hypothetical protein